MRGPPRVVAYCAPPMEDLGKGLGRYAVRVAGPTLALLVVFLVLWERAGVQTYVLTDDALNVLDAPAYVGILSQVGNLLWAATLAVCAFAAVVARSDELGLRRVVAGMAVLTGLLLADDAFSLHEQLGLGGLALWAGIAVFGIWWFVGHRDTIRRHTRLPLLVAAVAFGMASTLIDVGLDLAEDAPRIAGSIRSIADPVPLQATVLRIVGKGEEVAKLLAIEAWAIYAWTISRDVVRAP